MNPDLRRILEHKQALRRSTAARPLAEKIRLLDALRERALLLRRAGRLAARDVLSVREPQAPYGSPAENVAAEDSTSNDESNSPLR